VVEVHRQLIVTSLTGPELSALSCGQVLLPVTILKLFNLFVYFVSFYFQISFIFFTMNLIHSILLSCIGFSDIHCTLKKSQAQWILELIKNTENSTVFAMCRESLQELLYGVCEIVDGKENMCLLLLVKHTCPFLNVTDFASVAYIFNRKQQPLHRKGTLTIYSIVANFNTLIEHSNSTSALRSVLLTITNEMELFEEF